MTNGTSNETKATKATGAAAKRDRQARLLAATQPTTSDQERAIQAANPPTAETTDQDEMRDVVAAAAEAGAAAEERAVAAAKAEKPKAPKPPKPEVNRLEKVIEAQASPTMWQYARLAKAVKARIEAGQQFDDALSAVISQTLEILNGILDQQPVSSSDKDIDQATKSYFEQVMPKSMQRARGPRTAADESTSGK